MGRVQAQAIMTLDGYVAKQDNTIGRLFDWLQNGEVAIPTPAGDFEVHLTPPSAEHWQQWVSSLGALVCGRTLFEVAEGWQGRHTLDVPVVVVTHQVPSDWVDAHPDSPFSFETDGVKAAIERAQEIAGDRVVAVTGGTIAKQCLDLGLLDEVAVDLVPVVMGEGNRPFFGRLSSDEVLLGNPTVCAATASASFQAGTSLEESGQMCRIGAGPFVGEVGGPPRAPFRTDHTDFQETP
jgi:dihydrofolate reductase